MTVEELIAKLKNFPQDLKVYYEEESYPRLVTKPKEVYLTFWECKNCPNGSREYFVDTPPGEKVVLL